MGVQENQNWKNGCQSRISITVRIGHIQGDSVSQKKYAERITIMAKNAIVSEENFNPVLEMIYSAKQKAEYQVNTTVIDLYWSIGKYVSDKAKTDGWGKSTVKDLSSYILSKEPGIRGYSAQNIWRMKQFYETYCDHEKLSTLLRENTWSNNLHIMSKTKSYDEKEFYLRLARKEHYSARELERQIDSGYYERLALSSGKAPSSLEAREIAFCLHESEKFFIDVKGSIVMELAFYLATSPNYLLGYDDEMPGDNELIRTVISLIKTIKDEKFLSLLAGQIKVAAELYS